jgi:hypothetical protein
MTKKFAPILYWRNYMAKPEPFLNGIDGLATAGRKTRTLGRAP